MKKLPQIFSIVIALSLIMRCESVSSEKQALDGTWLLKYDSTRIGLREGWFDTNHDRSNWEKTTVPGFWSDDDYDGFAWYATTIQAKNFAAGYNLAIVFESIDDNAVLWLDGRLFGKQLGYGKKFYFDIGDKISDGEIHHLVLRIEDTGGPGGINGAVSLEPYINEEDILRTEVSKQTAPRAPEWALNTPVYEVFVRQHTQEGTFKALIEDLDRIKSLGIEMIWLMPIHPVGQEHKKGSVGSPYAVQDYYAVNPDMGSMDDFKDLVNEIHSRDMHIILDFVLNHTSWDNQLMTNHPDWYTHNEEGEIIPPNADWHDVADLNYDEPALRSYIQEMLLWWITETDIDGFRFDVAELVPNDFWAAAKTACQKVKPEVFFLAEGAKPELHLFGHDMTYSWNIWEGLIQLTQGNADPSEIKRSFEMEALQYPENALRMRFTENHDKTRSATLIPIRDLNLTVWSFVGLMKGNPMIYAGQEVGITGEYVPALFEQIPLDWGNGDLGIQQHMSDVLALRKQYISSDSPFQIIIADNDRLIMAYKHGALLAFFNFSETEFVFKAGGVEEILLGNLPLTDAGDFILAPHQFAVLK